MNKHQLLAEFLKTWPIERLRTMSIEEYTNLNKSDSFCYWLEQRTNILGGITGGSSFKFGIYKRTNQSNESPTPNTISDGEYAWHEKYGTDRDVAFKTIREIIVSIVNCSLQKKYNEIESIDFGSATKWKIAFLYSDYDIVNTFKKSSIFSILDYLGATYTVNDTRYELSQKILSFKKPEQDFFEFNGQFWQQILISQDLKKLLLKLSDRVIPYFRILDSIVTQFQLEPNNEKYYFNFNSNELIFTIGQRYVWNVSKNSYRYISLENRTDNAEVFASSKNVPEAYLNHITEISTTDDIFNYMKNAIELELKSTVKSSFRKNNKADFQEMVFNRVFRDRVLNSLNISDTTIVNQSNIQMNQLPSIPLNQILYGPPGTGKTYHTINKAIAIANPEFDLDQDRSLIKEEYQRLVDAGQIVFTAFHQSMTYEDFIEGIKPETKENNVIYTIKNGIFKDIANKSLDNWQNSLFSTKQSKPFDKVFQLLKDEWEENPMIEFPMKREGNDFKILGFSDSSISFLKASGTNNHTLSINTLRDLYYGKREFQNQGVGIYYPSIVEKLKSYDVDFEQESVANEKKNYVIIIDEINRGNVSQIFGELITLIEEDKRVGNDEALEITLPYSKENFGVPSNLHIIGTMNTADRSVEALDTALRRRFVFEEMPPKYDIEGLQQDLFGYSASDILKTINKRIEKLLDRDHQIGHAYFINKNESTFINSFHKNIIPLYFEGFGEAINLLMNR